mmetsp:Transcript_60859/g.125394  ORF Transcript_60859/g.125394 Transcript_60859/m.125394 type:complete len:159 (+) Transcript_60859:234-710(+)
MTHSVAIPQSIITLGSVLLFELDVVHHKFHPQLEEVWLIVGTCVMAAALNVTSMGLIGKTSAVTFQVVGHAKTCLIIASGFLLFTPSSAAASAQTAKNLLGISIAVVAMIWYGHLKSSEAPRPPATVLKEDPMGGGGLLDPPAKDGAQGLKGAASTEG